MDIVASAASVAQLLSQIISFVQQVYRARQNVRDGPKLLSDHGGQLQDLLRTVELIQNEKGLQTADIGIQLLRVQGIAKELQTALMAIATLQKKNVVGRYLRAIGTDDQRGRDLRAILDRLDQANADLSMRIQLAHVGVTGAVRDGFVAVLPTIRRIDENVQKALGGSRLATAKQLQLGEFSPRDDGNLPLDDEELEALGLNAADDLSVMSNSAADEADQLNAIAVPEESQRAVRAKVHNNVAKGKSTQKNLIIDAATFRESQLR